MGAGAHGLMGACMGVVFDITQKLVTKHVKLVNEVWAHDCMDAWTTAWRFCVAAWTHARPHGNI